MADVLNLVHLKSSARKTNEDSSSVVWEKLQKMIGCTPKTSPGAEKVEGSATPQVDGVDGQDEVDNDVCGELNPNFRPDGRPRFRSVHSDQYSTDQPLPTTD